MSIRNIEESRTLQKYCDKLDREGMYEKALEIAREILDGDKSPQEVMICVGKMKALAIGSKCDCYWNEKVSIGYRRFLEKATYEVDKKQN